MPYVFIGLGSNMGSKAGNLQTALDLLAEQVAHVAVSSVYDTAPMYDTDQDRFANAVLKAYTWKDIPTLVGELKSIEQRIGRIKTKRNGPRVIDLDLLFYGDTVFDDGKITVPHPRIQERAFVLGPLNEIARDFVHPLLKKTVSGLYSPLWGEDIKKTGSLRLFDGASECFGDASLAEKAVSGVGIEDAYSIKTMALKCVVKVVRLRGIRATMANILKQEMLSLGGDAAVHKDCISNKTDRSDVLLIGNLKQLLLLVAKLRVQVVEAREVAKAVETAIAGSGKRGSYSKTGK